MGQRAKRWSWVVAGIVTAGACGGDDGGGDATGASTAGTVGTTAATAGDGGPDGGPSSEPGPADSSSGATTSGATSTTDEGSDSGSGTAGVDPGPMVDVSDPQLYEYEFPPSDADDAVSTHDATQLAHLDTTVTPVGRLVVYLHGAGTPTTCGSRDHGEMLAGLGFHVLAPCYVSDYGVGNCGDDIGGCRLEAFEGIDHSPVIDIAPPDSIEVRVVKGLQYLQELQPGGDWQYYVDGDAPRWDKIVISGISHGASTSGLVGMNRSVDRVVSLSGPLDSGQAWLSGVPTTPIDRFYALTHTGDDQHAGHLQSFADMMLPGGPAVIDDAAPPYGDSHRLVTSAPTGNGHSSTQAGGASPVDGNGDWQFLPAWRYMYGIDP
jgi:hypothetical protein